MSEKKISYYDWELSFKKGNKLETSDSQELDEFSLGIPEKILKEFLRTWKEKNLE